VIAASPDATFREMLRFVLDREGYCPAAVGTGAEALDEVEKRGAEALVIDADLADATAADLCRAVRRSRRAGGAGLLVLSPSGDESAVVPALLAGADDCLPKPVRPALLLAKLRLLLGGARSASCAGAATTRVGPICMVWAKHEVTVSGRRADLTLTEFRILQFLAQHIGRPMSRSDIAGAARESGGPATERSVDFHFVGLRRKLGEAAEFIETVRGVGYRLREASASGREASGSGMRGARCRRR
jgi:two-component system phosphate regulon response regulator PhoB